ncbi:LCP family protein [Sedimentibacter sp.]|uniref:LCP family protein n=1 Tax=Sedimentibacter sp. TaxID=1960295 RepID=UPI00289A63CC|nr:LCP family protein [Sedimentibacter sp.]
MNKLKKIILNEKVLLITLSAVMIVLIIGSAYANSMLNKINYHEKPPIIKFENNGIVASRHSQPRIEDITGKKDKEIINILLIGKDISNGENKSRSDSMIIATINKKSNSIKLTSLMRDMYLEIPGYPDNRINAAYALGGMDLLTSTITQNFHVEIDGCVEVDFAGFEQIIDKIDGVDIELNRDEAYYLSTISRRSFKTGSNNLMGEEALNYARIRYIGHDDYERTERQRKVLVSAFNKLKGSDLKTLLDVADDILPLVSTNLTNTQILSLATNVVLMNTSNVETYRIPADGAFTPDTINDMAVLVPDLSKNRELLGEYIGY